MKFVMITASAMVAVFAAIFFAPGTPAFSSEPELFTCSVTRVHDGDGSIWCAEGPKIRLTAIAARELDETCSPGHPCPAASEASAQRELARLALGSTLTCEATGTSYDRITAWCWTRQGVELNCAMVKGGFALRWDKFDRDRRLCSQGNGNPAA